MKGLVIWAKRRLLFHKSKVERFKAENNFMLKEVYENSIWGSPTSTVDWCEPNYTHTYYVAETWNTISNLFTIVMGFLMFMHYRKNKIERRFRTTALTLMLVGIGSAAFHGSLKYYLQLADELPMLALTCSMTYLTLEMSNIRVKHKKLPYFGALICVLVSILHVYLQNAELFFVGFALLLSPALVYSGTMRGTAVVFRASKFAGAFLVAGYILWQIDRSYCSKTQKYFLHAWWHVFTALSEIYWLNGMVYLRREIIGQPSQLVLGGLWIKFEASKKLEVYSK